MSDILRRARLVNREIFEPTNKAHVESFKIFLGTGNWGDVQFYPEVPFNEAPATVMTKFARHQLKIKVESVIEKSERLAARGVLPLPKAETRKEAEARLVTANQLMKSQLAALNT